MTTTVNYDFLYSYPTLVETEETIYSSNKTRLLIYRYPMDFQSSANYFEQNSIGQWQLVTDYNPYWKMTERNMIDYPIETIEKTNNLVTNNQVKLFAIVEGTNGAILPREVYQLETTISAKNYLYASSLPNDVGYQLNMDEEMNKKIKFDKYTNCNIQQYFKPEGIQNFILWGYNKTLPIAQIKGAKSYQLNSWLLEDYEQGISYIQEISNSDFNESTEQLLNLWLDNLRTSIYNHDQNMQMTSYTYDPLIGVTSITDPRGNVMYYEYDNFNRLKHVKDKDGNILSKHEYNYLLQD